MRTDAALVGVAVLVAAGCGGGRYGCDEEGARAAADAYVIAAATGDEAEASQYVAQGVTPPPVVPDGQTLTREQAARAAETASAATGSLACAAAEIGGAFSGDGSTSLIACFAYRVPPGPATPIYDVVVAIGCEAGEAKVIA